MTCFLLKLIHNALRNFLQLYYTLLIIELKLVKMNVTELRCKVCKTVCDPKGYSIHRSCESCKQFYDRSVRKMIR